ncbi:hypothetical protein LOTGIDRAFT_228345 [Lottia gigantea]|uniref:Fe2OG dioxygenase domain-containing protein n=1 Tax=Lottia gigantea TaxID=225164 RepID=V4AVB9_LOTGI|nr:hypothetical protein LOTGIDRAFT_228345 [Lottia gigantea]ESO97781.1 hypothetical protein LOTGIDRAFT_228345 [Lottia gigantea]
MKFFKCQCYFKKNIFIKEFNLHITFLNREQFCKTYREILRDRGCKSEEQVNTIISQIEKEIERREKVNEESMKRKQFIKEFYKPLHPHIYTLKADYFHSGFLKLVDVCKKPNVKSTEVLELITTEKAQKVYSFPVFTEEFCRSFLEELEWFEKSDCPKGRPNTMNNYGVLLNELGFDEHFMTLFREEYLQPISTVLYPEWTGLKLDSHKAFIVTYKEDEDLDLADHFDNSEVTINVSLGKEFTGSELCFKGMKSSNDDKITTYENKTGIGLLHRGQHIHCAAPLKTGERYNLIIWMRSSSVRNQCCPMCNDKPELIEADGFGDGFTADTINVCNTL